MTTYENQPPDPWYNPLGIAVTLLAQIVRVFLVVAVLWVLLVLAFAAVTQFPLVVLAVGLLLVAIVTAETAASRRRWRNV